MEVVRFNWGWGKSTRGYQAKQSTREWQEWAPRKPFWGTPPSECLLPALMMLVVHFSPALGSITSGIGTLSLKQIKGKHITEITEAINFPDS